MLEVNQYPKGMKQVYRGLIQEQSYGDDDYALFLAGDGEPLAEQIQDGMDQWGRFATVRYFITDTELDIDELTDNLARIAVGAIDADYSHAYSEYTGYLWTDEELKIGGHDLLDELDSHKGHFAYLEFEYFFEAPESVGKPLVASDLTPNGTAQPQLGEGRQS